jgi:hypothetical protein
LAASQFIQKYVNFSTPLVCSSAIEITRAQPAEESSKSETNSNVQKNTKLQTTSIRIRRFEFSLVWGLIGCGLFRATGLLSRFGAQILIEDRL